MTDRIRLKPDRLVDGRPVFRLPAGDHLLTVHAMKQAVSRGMTIHDLLETIESPERTECAGPGSRYYREHVVRYVRNGKAVVVDYGAPLRVVVTVLYTDKRDWDVWNRENGVPLRDERHRPVG